MNYDKNNIDLNDNINQKSIYLSLFEEKISKFSLQNNDVDLCIVIGGDGTILWANHVFVNEDRPPFLAFNLGTLGYMATYCCSCYKSILDDVLSEETNIYYEKRILLKGNFLLNISHRYSRKHRTSLNLDMKRSSSLNPKNSKDFKEENPKRKNTVDRFEKEEENKHMKYNKQSNLLKETETKINQNNIQNQISHTELQLEFNDKYQDEIIYALNDITIERKDFTHMINTEIYYNDEPLTLIKSNGIIISSSTGSTAYSLSAGGTIMHYGLDCFILNSICPHSLSFRPIALPRGDKLKIILSSDSKDSVVINDGINKYHLSNDQGIEVEISDKFIELILIEKFFKNKSIMWKQKIIDQLGWNNSFKNVDMDECMNK